MRMRPFLVCVVINILMIAGCTQQVVFNPTPSLVTVVPASPSRTILIKTSVSTPSPTYQLDATGTPIALTPTYTVIPYTETIQPTMDAPQSKAFFIGLLKNNRGCQLPCLWGITPGEINLNVLNDFLMSFGEIKLNKNFYVDYRSHEQNGGITLINWENDIRILTNFSYYMVENKIDRLTLYTEIGLETGEGADLRIKSLYGEPLFYRMLNYYMLDSILTVYGTPSTVLVAPFPDDPQYPKDLEIPFSVVLFYPEKGILVEYIMPKEKNKGNFVGCPGKVGYLSLVVWNPERQLALKKVASFMSGPGINKLSVDYFKPIEEATTLSLEEFYQSFIYPENKVCLETPVEIWLEP